jgi:hypothetical protein
MVAAEQFELANYNWLASSYRNYELVKIIEFLDISLSNLPFFSNVSEHKLSQKENANLEFHATRIYALQKKLYINNKT